MLPEGGNDFDLLALVPEGRHGFTLWQILLKVIWQIARRLPAFPKATRGLNPLVMLPEGREGINLLAFAPEGCQLCAKTAMD